MSEVQGSAADRQRLTDLFHRHGNAIYAYASDRISTEDARDLVAEVFTVAWRRLATIRDGEERAWLFGVARRLIMAHRRHLAERTSLRERLITVETNMNIETAEGAVVDRQSVIAALSTLPVSDREVLLLRYWYDLSGSEAAKAAGCSGPAFAVRLHRARSHFKQALGRQVDGLAPHTSASREGKNETTG